MTERIPVSLLTGFLGSGKTTLLRRLLQEPNMKDVAVIINEFGEVGLDHLLIERGQDDVVLLDSGCLCCTVSNSLGGTLEDLHYRRLRGEIPLFTRVVIETSGLADPTPLLHLLLADPAIAKWYVLDGVVTTVDGLHGLEQLDAHVEAKRQAAVADLLIVTKADVSSPQIIDRLVARLNQVNPGAACVRAAKGEVPATRIVGIGRYDLSSKPAEVARWLTPQHDQDVPPHSHDDDIATYTLTLRTPMRWPDYAAWLERLRVLPANRLLRVKGVVALGDEQQPHVVQGVQHVFAHPTVLQSWPWTDGLSRLVFIVQDIAVSEVMATLTDGSAALQSARGLH